jgi:chromate reductase, NAD(P)H dehydrogenase (quinone)
VNVLGLSGSLRAASINSALLRAASRLAPPDMTVHVYQGLGDVPLFNPDREPTGLASVAALQQSVSQADALLIASPEYAHGISGTIKNALDWLVGLEAFASTPVAVYNTSPRAHHADSALRETLRTMAAIIIEPASITLPLLGANLDEDGIVATPAVAGPLRDSLTKLLTEVKRLRVAEPAAFPVG